MAATCSCAFLTAPFKLPGMPHGPPQVTTQRRSHFCHQLILIHPTPLIIMTMCQGSSLGRLPPSILRPELTWHCPRGCASPAPAAVPATAPRPAPSPPPWQRLPPWPDGGSPREGAPSGDPVLACASAQAPYRPGQFRRKRSHSSCRSTMAIFSSAAICFFH